MHPNGGCLGFLNHQHYEGNLIPPVSFYPLDAGSPHQGGRSAWLSENHPGNIPCFRERWWLYGKVCLGEENQHFLSFCWKVVLSTSPSKSPWTKTRPKIHMNYIPVYQHNNGTSRLSRCIFLLETLEFPIAMLVYWLDGSNFTSNGNFLPGQYLSIVMRNSGPAGKSMAQIIGTVFGPFSWDALYIVQVISDDSSSLRQYMRVMRIHI